VPFDAANPHFQQLLCHQTFEFAEWLLCENPAHFFSPGRIALAQNQLAAFLEEGPRELRHFFLQLFLTLQIG
jgi:hypothetical protein